MPGKPLWRVSVTVPLPAEDALVELLSDLLRAGACSYRAAGSPRAQVSVYLPARPGPGILRALRAAFAEFTRSNPALRPGRIDLRPIRREDWAESWKKHFKPLVIGRRLRVQPSWTRSCERADQPVVVLDPGLSFGTGHHPTTRFCLEELVASRVRDRAATFLDLGTGSGILAIAAAKLGYRRIEAIDLDPEAIRVARANARANRVESQIRLRVRDLRGLRVLRGRSCDLVCANLTADLLITQRARVAARVRRGGTLVLAGILKREFAGVAAAYGRLGFRLAARSGGSEWRSGRWTRAA